MSRYVASSTMTGLDLALAREQLAATISTVRELEADRAERERAERERRQQRRIRRKANAHSR